MKRAFVALMTGLLMAGTFGIVDRLSAKEGIFDGGEILYTKPLKAVPFSHKAHVEEKGLGCAKCHSGLFEMEALKAQENKDFTMESLYRGRYCGACHDGRGAFASNTQCARCHIGVKGYEELKTKSPAAQKGPLVYKAAVTLGVGDAAVRFNHETHTPAARCSACHTRLFSMKAGKTKITLADHGKKAFCFTCHDGRKAFTWNDCSKCHAKVPVPQAAISFGRGDGAIPFRHQTHTPKQSCSQCHPKVFSYGKGSVRMTFADHGKGKGCFSCHTGKQGAASYACGLCHKKVPAPQEALLYKPQGAAPVKFLHTAHQASPCDACHPKLFETRKGATKMPMAEMYQGRSCGTCHNGTQAFRAFECAKCHKSE